MTNEEATKILNEMIEYGWLISDWDKCVAIEALDIAIKALEQEPYEDVISRKAVLDNLSELNAVSFYEAQEDSKETYYEIRQMIKNLPSVIPQ